MEIGRLWVRVKEKREWFLQERLLTLEGKNGKKEGKGNQGKQVAGGEEDVWEAWVWEEKDSERKALEQKGGYLGLQ